LRRSQGAVLSLAGLEPDERGLLPACHLPDPPSTCDADRRPGIRLAEAERGQHIGRLYRRGGAGRTGGHGQFRHGRQQFLRVHAGEGQVQIVRQAVFHAAVDAHVRKG